MIVWKADLQMPRLILNLESCSYLTLCSSWNPLSQKKWRWLLKTARAEILNSRVGTKRRSDHLLVFKYLIKTGKYEILLTR